MAHPPSSDSTSSTSGTASSSYPTSVVSDEQHSAHKKSAVMEIPKVVRNSDLIEIFTENVVAKILQVAQKGLQIEGSLPSYPHTVPQEGPAAGQYEYREADFWTCGFFPGSIYALLERADEFPAHFSVPAWYQSFAYDDLLKCGRHWSVALNDMSGRTDTHDMGFIIQPALQKDWELTGNKQSLDSVKRAAYALASRYDPRTKAIRSWDRAINNRYAIDNMNTDFLVIIDSMCNLDLLFYIGHLVQDETLVQIAVTHADTVRKCLLRDDYSTYHLANLDPLNNGAIKQQMTNQGYNDASTWSRGQAWAIMGNAQTYLWTKERRFLDTAIGCANMFLGRLSTATHHSPWVPAWDFDAPPENPMNPLRDTSAGVIAANGLLLIHQALQTLVDRHSVPPPAVSLAGEGDYLDAALLLVQQTLHMSLDRDFASISPRSMNTVDHESRSLRCNINPSQFECILRNATTNNNEDAHQPYRDHGLVYADYYLLEFGNKLCRMGLC